MKTITKLLAVLAVTLIALGVSVPVALAAAPTNDTFANATPAALGFSQVLDTAEATTDSDDAQLNTLCGAPATDASVWYALEGADQEVVVDVAQSTYSAGLLVGVGSPGNLELVTCGPETVTFFATAGTTYYVLAFDYQGDGGGNGGALRISFNDGPPLPQPSTLDITVNPTGMVNTRTGVATISGTYTCANAGFIEASTEARQRVGRFTIVGSSYLFDLGTCDGAPHSWSAEVYPHNGKFAGGKVMTVTFAFSCGPLDCATDDVEQTVMLRGGRK